VSAVSISIKSSNYLIPSVFCIFYRFNLHCHLYFILIDRLNCTTGLSFFMCEGSTRLPVPCVLYVKARYDYKALWVVQFGLLPHHRSLAGTILTNPKLIVILYNCASDYPLCYSNMDFNLIYIYIELKLCVRVCVCSLITRERINRFAPNLAFLFLETRKKFQKCQNLEKFHEFES
jgi:hypothetical protein